MNQRLRATFCPPAVVGPHTLNAATSYGTQGLLHCHHPSLLSLPFPSAPGNGSLLHCRPAAFAPTQPQPAPPCPPPPIACRPLWTRHGRQDGCPGQCRLRRHRRDGVAGRGSRGGGRRWRRGQFLGRGAAKQDPKGCQAGPGSRPAPGSGPSRRPVCCAYARSRVQFMSTMKQHGLCAQ